MDTKMTITKDTPLKNILEIGAKCNKCGSCCSFGSGFVLDSELSKIAASLNMDKERFKKECAEEQEIFHTPLFKFRTKKQENKPYGKCMFLQPDNLCQIQSVKPLHCRIGNCAEHGDDLHTWFILNHCLNAFDPESIRQYNSYIKTGGRVLKGAELKTIFPEKKKLKTILSYERFR
jgi:Fe-S-cluster containining protein